LSDTPGDGQPFKVWSFVHENVPGRDQNRFWQALEEQLGSPYEPILSLTPDYATKFPTLLASGDLPDMFPIPFQYAGMGQLLDAAAADLTEHLAGDAINDYPALANIPSDSWKGCIFDGKIMTLPIPRGLTSTWVMTNRQDIFDEVGVPASPSSYEEFRSMCVELTKTDGTRWAIGANPLDYLRSMLSIPRYFIEENGTFTSAYTHEGQKEALEAARDLYASGLVIPDAIGQHANQSKQWLVAGQTAMTWDTYSGFLGFFFSLGVPAGNLNMLQIPDWEGDGQGMAQLGEPNNILSAISNADPARIPTILNIANFLATPFGTTEFLFRKFGVEGVHYNWEDGVPVPDTATAPEAAVGQAYLIDGPAHLYYTGLGEEVKRMQEHQKQLTENAATDPAYGLYSETRSGDGPALEAEILAVSLDIVSGRKPVSDWDGAVENYLSGGGTQMCDELTEALQNAS
ncbi:extracellular solute-binding protein, partial [Pseudactinotalea suaedae]